MQVILTSQRLTGATTRFSFTSPTTARIFIRNKKIVDACDKLIAFWDGNSKGTKHSINLAKNTGKLLKIIKT